MVLVVIINSTHIYLEEHNMIFVAIFRYIFEFSIHIPLSRFQIYLDFHSSSSSSSSMSVRKNKIGKLENAKMYESTGYVYELMKARKGH